MSKSVFLDLCQNVRLIDIDFSKGCIKESKQAININDKKSTNPPELPSRLASSLSDSSYSSKNKTLKGRTDSDTAKVSSKPKMAELSFTEEINVTDFSEIDKIKNDIQLSSIELNKEYNLRMDDSNK